jgi:hypothetical protein
VSADLAPVTVPTTEPSGAVRSGSLLRAEVRRFGARRFIRVLLALGLLGWLVAVVTGLTQYGHPSAADLASARHQVQQEVQSANAGRQQCLSDPNRPSGVPVEQLCGDAITAADIPLEQFLSDPPFSFASAARGGALGFGAVAAVLAYLIGATWIGAEWSTRSLVALLFWEPRRTKVMAVKLGVLTAASALLGVVAEAAWLAMAGILNAVAGDGGGLPAGFWSDLLALQGRAVLLTVLAALVGFGLVNLIRNTAAALGAGFVYFAVVETAVRILRPTWQPWLLSNNAVALMNPGGLRIFINDGFGGGHEYLIHNLPAGIELGAVTAVLVGVGVLLFARRDLH